MRHPYRAALATVTEEFPSSLDHCDFRMPVLFYLPLFHFSSKRLRHPVQTVADAEDWDAEFEDLGIRLWAP